MTADLIVLRDSTPRNAPATLREWARAIEAGEHGEVSRLALVLDADKQLRVAYMGEGEVGPNLLAMLQMGVVTVLRRMMGERA